MLAWIAGNTLMAGAMAIAVGLLCLLLKPRPALAHVLWLLVLLRLVAPPLNAPVRIDAVGAVGSAASAAGSFLERHYLDAFGEPGAELRRELRKRRVTQAQFGYRIDEKSTAGAVLAPRIEVSAVAFRESQFAVSSIEAAPAAPVAAGAILPAPPASGSGSLELSAAGALGLAWLGGSVVTGAWLSRRTMRFGRVLRSATPADAPLVAAVAQVADRLGMRPPRVRVTDRLASPVVWTLGRPVLLWPAAGAGASVLFQQSSVIAHELAHIRRRDHWMVWLEMLLTVALWWNPVMWIARRQMRRYAEFACDAWAVGNFPAQRRSYAELLIAISARGRTPLGAVALGAVDADVRSFERRLRLIMGGPASYRAPRAASGLIAALSLLAVAPAWSVMCEPPQEPHISVQVDGAIDPALRPAIETWILARKAQRLFELEDWAHAGAAYQKLIERRGADGEAFSRLGVARLMEGRPQEAIAAFERQCELNWRRQLGEFNLGAAHARAGNLDEAVQRIAFAVRIGFDDLEMLEADPDLDPVRQRDEFRQALETVERAAELQAAADKAFERGDWAAASDLWSQVLELTPWNTRAIHLRGYCEIATGAYDDAIASYGRLLEINVMVPLACYNTACAASLKGDGELALASLERAIDSGFRDYKLLSSDTDLDGVRGDPAFERIEQKLLKTARLAREIELASEFGDWTAAQAAAEALVEIDPGNTDAWGRLGTARLAQGDAPGAAEAFARQVATGRDVAEGLYSLAAALAAQQRHAEALAHLGAAIDAGFEDGERLESDKALAPLRDAPGFERITQALTDAGVLSNFGAVDWNHLLDRSAQRAAESPEDGRNCMRLGWAHLRLGHYDDAIVAFTEQRRLGFAPGIAQYNVACALALSGRSDEAMEALERSLQYGYIDPEHAATDLDLKTLRDQPRFDAFLDKARRMRKADRDGDSMVY